MEDISIWLRDFITEFRKQSEKLSQEERSRISNLDDFFSPCQILLLWFRDANFQCLICTHDSNRNDMEIDVEGPIPTHEAIDRLDSILKNPAWDRGLSKEEKKHVYDKTAKFSKIIEGRFLDIIHELQNQPFRKPLATSLVGFKGLLVSRDFWWNVMGNIAEIDKTKIIGKILKEAKKEVTRIKVKPPATPPPKSHFNSCATFFYPPIWVGKLPRKTFKEKAHGSWTFAKKALGLEYKDRIVIINQNGLIAIDEEKIPKATRMLNEIMATSLLMGLPASAVRELEVYEAKIDPSSSTITSWRTPWGTTAYTPRTQLTLSLLHEPTLEGRIEIEKENLVRAIRQAERISEDPDISDFLIFFLEGHGHLKNSEYSQSFIMSWFIIERHLHWLWKKFLKEEQILGKRRKKMTNPTYWTIDFILEGLNFRGRLSIEDYEVLMSLKNKRNDIIHKGKSTTLKEAEKCFKIARDIVKQRSGLD